MRPFSFLICIPDAVSPIGYSTFRHKQNLFAHFRNRQLTEKITNYLRKVNLT